MGKVKVNVNKSELESVINDIESKGPLKNRTVLSEAIADTDWARNFKPKPITPSVVTSRIKEFGIEPKTKKGRYITKNKLPNKKAVSKIDINKELLLDTPKKYHNVIVKINTGSKIAAIKLKCLECSNWQSVEIRNCPIVACALYTVRPYK